MKITVWGNNGCLKYEVEEYCNKLSNASFSFFSREYFDANELLDELLKTPADVAIFEIECFDNTEEEIVSMIQKFKNGSNCNVIIFCPGFHEDSSILVSLRAIGVSNFIFEEKNLGKIQNSILEMVEDRRETSVEEQEKILSNREQKKENIIKSNSKIENVVDFSEAVQRDVRSGEKRIAVVGAMERIGCTRIALQLVKYLNIIDENAACYIQMNGEYFENICDYFYVDEDDDGSVLLKNTRLYKDGSKLASMRSKGYSKFVYDYGCYDRSNLESILERDIIVVVGGTGPSEIKALHSVAKDTFKNPATCYVFCDCVAGDKEDVLVMMSSKRNQTYFFSYDSENHADPFIFDSSNKDIFDSIMATKLPEPSESERRKNKKLFRMYGRK